LFFSSVKTSPGLSLKKVKAQQREKAREKLGEIGKSAGELMMKKITVVEGNSNNRKNNNSNGDHDHDYQGDEGENKQAQRKKTKVVRQTFAFGGFDQDIQEHSGASMNRINKKRSAREANPEDWKEFDPNKRLKKGGKTGTSSFKSKKRFKRRK
jgi:hypothetical protein